VSRLQQARKAVRPALKGRMMLSGPAGAGKTRSGLIISEVLAERTPILGVDTEKESMLTYADDFDFTHLPWQPPYDPRELADLLGDAGDTYGVILIDSLSHFWRKEGGVLDIAAGKFTGWKEARPVQEALIEAILNCRAHVVLGVRSKVEHTQEVENGRNVVKKLGMAAQQDDDLEFEMNVAVELSMDHTATISKSRTTVLPVSRAFKAGQVAELAAVYRDWLKSGEPPASKAAVDDLRRRVNALDEERRGECRNEFLASHGRPEQLRASQVDAAKALVAGFEAKANGTSQPDAGQTAGEAPIASDVLSPTSAEADRKRWAKDIHVKATRAKVAADVLDLIIMNETAGRTEHADQLDEDEKVRVETAITRVADGRLSVADLRAAVTRFLAVQGETPL
jgi:hypothetical protein